MQILSVTLKNFKTHRDRQFTFAPGTNAICGENGAGKTSILEAIAWVLFNYLGDYAKDDLIRNGSGSAEVTVEFISNQDDRTYTVQRHTSKGYTLFDPQLNQRLPYTRIKDEVLPWLREHLGVAPGTDLGELFARTVGVPQGTFTADFLQTAENRKTVFDKVLKVEEYKTVYKELNSLRRYAEAKAEAVTSEIARFEERLATWDELQTRQQAIATEITHNEGQLAAFDQQLQTLMQERDALQAQATQIQQLQTQQQQTQADMAGRQQAIALLTQSLEQAQQAAKICVTVRPAYEAYQAAETALQTLARQQTERQTRQKSQQKLRKTLELRAADITRLKVQLDGFEAATAEIAQLQPQVQQQTELEAQLQALQQAQTTLAQVRGEHQATAKQQAQQAQQVTKTVQEIDRLQALAQMVAAASDLAPQRDRLQQQLSRLEAARQFETELQRLVSQGRATSDRTQAQVAEALQALAELHQTQPPESAAIATIQQALETGVTVHQSLLGAVQQILDDLSGQTDAEALRSQLQACQTRLTELAKQQNQVAVLPERRQQLTQLHADQTALPQRLEQLQQKLTEGEALSDRLGEVQTALQALEDPKGRCAVLARSQQQQPTVQKRYGEMQAAQAGIQHQIDDLEQQLHAFETLDTDIATQTQAKQIHQADYQQYLQYVRAAQDEARLTRELTTVRLAMVQLQEEATQLQTALAEAQVDFDPQMAQQVTQTYQTVRSERDRLAGSLPQQQQLLAELLRQLDDLKALAAQRAAAIEERKQRERIKRFVNFARKAYKAAGPRITERYVQQISREGDRLFRELLNRPNVALTVLLALLKVIADIDIAFFDEPTTNMDRPRRESLAEAIARIRSFKQLFVISHDDTFEKVTENVIVVEREG